MSAEEDLGAALHLFPDLCLDTYLESVVLPRVGVQDHCSDSTIRIGGKGRTIFPRSRACCPWLS
jgi:hypothetical protein